MQIAKGRRTLNSITEWLTPEEIYKLIHKDKWNYLTDKDFYWSRDLAMMSGLFLTGGRVHEWLLTDADMFFVEDELLKIKGMHIGKRTEKIIKKWGKNVQKRPLLAFPLAENKFIKKDFDELIPFTWLIVDYLLLLKERGEKRLFPFSPCRAWQIVKHCTGMWPHWFRAQCETFMCKLLGDPYSVARFIGVVNPNTVFKYMKYDYRLYAKSSEKRPWYKKFLRGYIPKL